MLNENRFLGTFRGHNTRTTSQNKIKVQVNKYFVYNLSFIHAFIEQL